MSPQTRPAIPESADLPGASPGPDPRAGDRSPRAQSPNPTGDLRRGDRIDLLAFTAAGAARTRAFVLDARRPDRRVLVATDRGRRLVERHLLKPPAPGREPAAAPSPVPAARSAAEPDLAGAIAALRSALVSRRVGNAVARDEAVARARALLVPAKAGIA